MFMDNPDLFLNNLLPEICIFNAVITSVPFPDFFSLNFYGCSAQILRLNIPFYIRCTAAGSIFKICSAPELIFFF